MTPKKKSKPILKIAFDTNVLFTNIAYNLVKDDVRLFIKENSNHSDIEIKWFLSNIVINERRYQMRNKAIDLLQPVRKLERLLGHNLNITEEILIQRVDIAISEQLQKLDISTIDLDTSKVNWEELINNASFRLPPFTSGEKEKGFRDALIAESFFQLINKSPSTASICRLVFVTEDEILSDFIKSSTSEKKNIRVLSNLSEIESLINTLASKVTEKFITEISDNISAYFFKKGDNTCLFYKKGIRHKIEDDYNEELKSIPVNDLYRENGTWRISKPVFIKKVQQRMYWSTPIKVDAKLFKHKYEYPTHGLNVGSTLSDLVNKPQQGMSKRSLFSDLLIKPQLDISKGIGAALAQHSDKVEINKGYSNFEVTWSVNITSKQKLTNPKIDEIQFVSTKWDELLYFEFND